MRKSGQSFSFHISICYLVSKLLKCVPGVVLVLNLMVFFVAKTNAQTLDTLVDVEDYQLHFRIIKGRGVPILFESGGGETAEVWRDIIPDIASITGTTIITYDRSGFGLSSFSRKKHGILNGIIGLETGLKKLGYNKHIILAAHSQGGIYAGLYAYRHPERVKGAVLIDISSSCWFAGKRIDSLQVQSDKDKLKYKNTNPGLYYLFNDLTSNFNYVRDKPFPKNIPIIDIVAHRPFKDSTDVADWRNCHAEFVAEAKNREGITAIGSGHYVYKYNPQLVIITLAQMYAQILPKREQRLIMTRILDYSIKALNRYK